MDYIKKLTFTIFFFISFVVNTAHSKTTKVIVFGDSLIAGYGLLKEDGFVNQLQNKINHSKINLKLINSGVSGETSTGLLNRFKWVLEEEYDAVIISIGAKKGTELLKSVGLKKRLNHYPHQLSGGEQQRVAIARSLISSPEIIIADEPTGNLDKRNSEEVMKLIFKLQSDFASTLILVTHDETIAKQCDKTIKLDNGLIIKDE